MHPNPIFRQETEARHLAFVAHRGFGTLAVNADAGPQLSHIPFVMSGDGTSVDFHLVRSNPIARAASQTMAAVLSVTGPDSYISPDWYGADDQVPTWNYVSVHLRGQLITRPDSALRPHLDALSAVFEQRLLPKPPWTTDKLPDDLYEKMARQIVPMRLNIDDIQGTWKIGQNKTTEMRGRAANVLSGDEFGEMVHEMAALMRETLAD